MFLKRLEIIGFKSFAERIGIDFVHGVTAIVGPNGSGKSNITDAIRWVLGEQSAKSLRGAKMEDVIFAGSDSRKPLNFAEVTLILDNSKGLFPLDYTEISVSRRVFRSGESAYLLNGQQCRLKDINDVFMDSGVGKEAFSIISQGRVDQILNSRPEDRRSILDEAAGVLKYRTRKQKAEYKLFETSDNLDRVLDILKELETRIEPLQESAQSAKQHAVLLEQSKELDVMLLNYDARNFGKEIEAKMTQAEAFEKEKNEMKAQVENAEKASIHLKEQLFATDKALEQFQQEMIEKSAEAEKWEGRRLLSAEKRRNTGLQIERIREELKSKEGEHIQLQAKMKVTKARLADSGEQYRQIAKEIDRITKILKRSAKETETELEELKAAYIDLLNEEATLRNELKHTEERLVGEKSSSERITEQTMVLRERLKQLQAEMKEKKQQLTAYQKEKKEVEASYAHLSNVLQKEEKVLRHKQELLQQAYNKQHELQGRVRALESMEADFSGFFSGVKEILIANQSNRLRGIHGAVAELMTVETAYVKAIETALGGATQHIVTATEADARKAIGYLRAKNAGRATFLPLDVMKPRKIQPSLLQQITHYPDFVGTADRLVQADSVYARIIENLLGNVVVAASLPAASEIAKALHYRYRVVTLDGDVVNAGGSLTGGGVKARASVFTRKAELETLKEQLTKMASSIHHANETIGDMNLQAAEFMQKMEHARQLNEKTRLEIASVEASIRETEMAMQTTEVEISSVEIGRRGTKSAEAELLQKREALTEQHDQVKNALTTIRNEIDTLERFAADWRNEEVTLTKQLSELRERAAVLREQKGYETTSLQEMERTAELVQRKVETLNEELHFFVGGDGGEELTIEEITEQMAQASSRKKEIEVAILRSRKRRTEQSEQLEAQEDLLRKLQIQLNELNAVQNKVTIQLSRIEVTYEAIVQRLLNDYGLRPDFRVPAEFDEQSAREKLLGLHQRLTAIGPVNPGAIEEYEEVFERYEFLKTQRNDLLQAKSTLQEAMQEMDAEMTARFSSTFNAVQSEFRRVFKEMFGGGDADLILTDPNNLLETGIDIVARPPGKKLQNLSLLSGGERALTAITLLFSIIEVRPVPFCILDEVEAALDEANVIRYSKYLKAFSDRTQFIVITHRKGTMEGADVLYGITMQESGVSKLISVKLSEVPEETVH